MRSNIAGSHNKTESELKGHSTELEVKNARGSLADAVHDGQALVGLRDALHHDQGDLLAVKLWKGQEGRGQIIEAVQRKGERTAQGVEESLSSLLRSRPKVEQAEVRRCDDFWRIAEALAVRVDDTEALTLGGHFFLKGR